MSAIKPVTPSEAVMSLTSGKDRLFLKDRLPDGFLDYALTYNSANPRHFIFKPIKNFREYPLQKDRLFAEYYIENIETDLVAVHWKMMQQYYGGVPARRYGQWSRTNKTRLAFLDQLAMDHIQELVDCASAGAWRLSHNGRYGYFIHANNLDKSNQPIKLIHEQYDITHTLGRLAITHANKQ